MPYTASNSLRERLQFVRRSSRKLPSTSDGHYYWSTSHEDRLLLQKLGVLGEPPKTVTRLEYFGPNDVSANRLIRVYPAKLERVLYLLSRLDEISRQRGSGAFKIDLDEL